MRSLALKSRFPAGQAARALWLARWLLVLVLAWDQAGAPLHQHHHDFGADALSLGAAAPGGMAVQAHVDHEDDHAMGHASLAVWPRADGRTASAGQGAEQAAMHALPVLDAVAADRASFVRWHEPLAPPASWRSLPPAGRAPPLPT